MLATLASQIPILAPALPPLGSGGFDLTPFDQKTGHSSLRVYQDPQKLIFLDLLVRLIFERVLYSRASYNRENTVLRLF